MTTKQELEALAAANAHIEAMQAGMRLYLTHRMSADSFISHMIHMLDGQEQREVQGKIDVALGEGG
jgi:hypothetical protein